MAAIDLRRRGGGEHYGAQAGACATIPIPE